MKFKKIVLGSLMVLGVIGSIGVGKQVHAENNPSAKVYLSNDYFRETLTHHVESQLHETVENQLPSIDQLNRLEHVNIGDFNDPVTASLTGLQHVKNAKSLGIHYGGQISDFRPLAGMTSLESLTFGLSINNQVDQFTKIDFMSDMKQLKHVYFEAAFTDLTPLNELDNLEGISLEYGPEATAFNQLVSTESKEAVFANPVTYSKQFEGGELTVSCRDSEWTDIPVQASTDGKIITVSDIPEGTESIVVVIKKSSGESSNYRHELKYKLPLVWY